MDFELPPVDMLCGATIPRETGPGQKPIRASPRFMSAAGRAATHLTVELAARVSVIHRGVHHRYKHGVF
jgi:hypothetical protein